jgi:hypothetical protein
MKLLQNFLGFLIENLVEVKIDFPSPPEAKGRERQMINQIGENYLKEAKRGRRLV